MPIEIKELIVKTTIDNSGTTVQGTNLNQKQMKRLMEQMKDKVVEECMQKIQRQMERENDR